MSTYEDLKVIQAVAHQILDSVESGETRVHRVLACQTLAVEHALWSVYADHDFRRTTGLNPQCSDHAGRNLLVDLYAHATPEQEVAIACALLSYREFMQPVQAPEETDDPVVPDYVQIPSARLKHWAAALQSDPSRGTCLSIANQIDRHLVSARVPKNSLF